MMNTNIQNSELLHKPFNNRLKNVSKPFSNRLVTVSPTPLGNITSYSAKPTTKGFQKLDIDVKNLKYDYKKVKIKRKGKVGKKVERVSYCGVRSINRNAKSISMVKGEKEGIYYHGMQRCGSVWFCEDCMYKLMKARAEELYGQLQAYQKQGKTVIFATFTLQHNKGDKLKDLHNILLKAFNFANTHRSWVNIKKTIPVEFLRALEVLYGKNGWHPHLHCLFVADEGIMDAMNVFSDLYKKELKKQGLLVNEHTVSIDKWNGTLDSMTDYLFKGMLEREITGGNLKTGEGKTFFDLIDDDNDMASNEFIKVMKGKRQYHSSRGFFNDMRIKSDEEILKDDKIIEVLFNIPIKIYEDIRSKGIALHLLNEYEYGGIPRMTKLLELYDCDTSFIN